ncbi:hypothetical protein MJN76_31390, partial [Salmonella enterica subsp. enterica serovar Anatum]|nr:hypothetical protein [Salmonella enterica subsp. enterica serovar Anatum]
RHQFRQPLCGFLNIFDVIVQIVNLTAAQDFTQNRFPYYQAIIGYNAFIKAMNAKAKALGMTHTRFVEPTGLSIHNVSTARDLTK